MINASSDYIDILKINPSYAVVYQEYVGDRSRYNNENSAKNLEHNKHSGEMSKKAVMRLQTALDWMLLVSKRKDADSLRGTGKFKFKVSMITLTLPAVQIHNDLYVKKMMLNEFFTVIRKKFNIQNYIWKAEKQGNGNIHFHIIIDKYIFYKDINRIWNQILNTHGYIEIYRANQQKKHENGFYYDKKISKHWSKSAQLKALKTAYIPIGRNQQDRPIFTPLKKSVMLKITCRNTLLKILTLKRKWEDILKCTSE